ncbi:YfcC family protein, partial [Limosilactobacillus fermentum]
MQAQPEKKRHRFKMPSAFTILFIIIIIIAVLSWFIPAGKYSTDSS